MMRVFVTTLLFLTVFGSLRAQSSSDSSKLLFDGDFRFRIEQDWNSMRSNGTLRTDRSRFRYRVRLGLGYELKDWASVGVRMRTGDPKKQQDPQVTLGTGAAEFGLLPLGLERAYFQAKKKGFVLWLGKNSFPFKKNNELFWSDNVFPEGVFLSKRLKGEGKRVGPIDLGAGHFILSSTGASLEQDAYMQGVQFKTTLLGDRLSIFPAFYYFNDIADRPDGGGTFNIDYAFLNAGASLTIHKDKMVQLELDFMRNLKDYGANDSIALDLRDQRIGYSLGLSYGTLRAKGDWKLKATYAYMERYSAVDYMAQNDWARWNYSNSGSPDGRLTNFRGLEMVLSHAIGKDAALTVKVYSVEQLIAYGSELEDGDRIRLDLDIKF